MSVDKYTPGAWAWTRTAYADADTYLQRRADLIGHDLRAGDVVLDLACGDGGLARFLAGFDYRGVDLNEAMVVAARRNGVTAELADLNAYVPAEHVAATTLFRALYYVRDRRRFFSQVASYTTHKLVFDVNPRQYDVDDVVRDLHATGWGEAKLHPFFVPQRVRLPAPAITVARALERRRPIARAILRVRFTYLVTASAR